MSTRLKRPSFWRQILFAVTLVGLQAYLGYSVLSGQYGIESQRQIEQQLVELKGRSAALQAELDSMRHKVGLFTPRRLDPDIVSERARALLSMSEPDDLIVMVDRQTGEPVRSSFDQLAADQLSDEIDDSID